MIRASALEKITYFPILHNSLHLQGEAQARKVSSLLTCGTFDFNGLCCHVTDHPFSCHTLGKCPQVCGLITYKQEAACGSIFSDHYSCSYCNIESHLEHFLFWKICKGHKFLTNYRYSGSIFTSHNNKIHVKVMSWKMDWDLIFC